MRDEISKYEAGQLNSHCAWFVSEYGGSAKVSHFLISPTKKLSYYANFSKDVYIIWRGKLRGLKGKIKTFIQSLYSYKLAETSDETLQDLLDEFRLNASDFKSEYNHKTK